MNKAVDELPERATTLIAAIRVAHCEGHKKMEHACREKLVREYGIEVSFTCCNAVERDLGQTEKQTKRVKEGGVKWIHIGERTPDKGCNCLIYMSSVYVAMWDGNTFRSGVSGFCVYNLVTHWAELPAAPGEAESS